MEFLKQVVHKAPTFLVFSWLLQYSCYGVQHALMCTLKGVSVLSFSCKNKGYAVAESSKTHLLQA